VNWMYYLTAYSVMRGLPRNLYWPNLNSQTFLSCFATRSNAASFILGYLFFMRLSHNFSEEI